MNETFRLVPWLLFLPLLGLLINILVGRRLGEKGVGIVASLATGLAFGLAVVLTVTLKDAPEPVTVPFAEWIHINGLSVDWAFRVDTLSTVMMLVVSGVGCLIHIYAIGYMQKDVRHNGDPARYRRFFIYFNLFIASMMVLVTAGNYLVMFVGWEGVGLCSYLLIGFWFEKGENGTGNALAGQKAFVVNRIGDLGLLLALFMMFWYFGTFDFNGVFQAAGALGPASAGVILAITLFMLLGVAGKSAQLPLFVWLPDAMAGPTPVSALIHAATMVTAGVYLVARSYPLFALVPQAQVIVTWVGTLTAIFAATIAVAQFDIKKVLAYSTMSQLGFMVAAVGMGAFTAGMFHLVTHAFFKALLFLAAGSVIQGLERGHEKQHHEGHHGEEIDPQDMRVMGGLQHRMPITFWVFLAGTLAIAGVAPLSGFFSKDEILAASTKMSPAIFVILLATAFLTAFYMGRLFFMTFYGKPRSDSAAQATESPAVMTTPLVILAILSVLGGLINLPRVLTLEKWLEHTLGQGLTAPFSWVTAFISLGLAVLGLFLAWKVYCRRNLLNLKQVDPLEQPLGALFTGMRNKWWVDELYHAVFVKPFQYVSSQVLANWVDQKMIDGAVNGAGEATSFISKQRSRLQNGYVRNYALIFLLGVVTILAYLGLK
jgi:NADH-quinone oxidoreductase subunit L